MLKYILWSVVLPFVFSLPFVVLTYAFFWYETVNGPHGAALARLSKGREVWWVFRGIFTGSLAVALVLVTFPLGWLGRRSRCSETQGSHPPVLLIHGLYHNAGAWLFYRRWLKRAGYFCVDTFQYSSWGTSFDELTGDLVGVIDGLYVRCGKPVILIGHSLGGLLARACAQDPSSRGKIGALVTLGSPHQGSKLAALALGGLGRSLIHRGPLIAAMERRTTPPFLPRLAVVSPVDNMVLPNEAMRVSGEEWEYHHTPPISHVSMLYHAPTSGVVVEFLRSSETVARG